MGSLLIRNGTVVTATDRYVADVYIEGETIHTIGKDLRLAADRSVDAAGCYVFPGGVDPHTHLEMPYMGTSSSDSYETGTRAALFGGTTTVIDYANQSRGGGLGEALDAWQRRAAGNCLTDYGFHMSIVDLHEGARAEIGTLCAERGVTSFKVFTAYKGALMSDDLQILEIMAEAKRQGGLVTVHAENGDMIAHLVAENLRQGNTAPRFHALSRPEIVDDEATGRVIDLAWLSGAPLYIVHMNAAVGVNRLRAATQRNQRVLGETCPQYLLLDADLYDQGFEGAKWVMSPTLRKQKDRDALWSALDQGLVQVVGTDHCPFTLEQKRMGEGDFSRIPNGAPGIENRLELLFSEGVAAGRISLNTFVAVTSTNAARIFGLFPRKGTIAVGSDADLVVFDPRARHTLSVETQHMRCDYSAYEGREVTGRCRTVVLRGAVAVHEGKIEIDKGYGQYLPRARYDALAWPREA